MSYSSDRPLVFAVQDPELQDRLRRLLRDESVRVELLPELASRAPVDIHADVVVLRADKLDEGHLPEVIDSAGDRHSPGVLVIGESEDEGVEEVRLIAAGASAVLDPETDGRELAHQLVELAEAEARGGLQGPESAGSVADPQLADFHSRSPRMRDFIDVVRRVAKTDSSLLLTGETGVGKERLARAIHAEGARSHGPFVGVNCGALSETLLESELFGHRKGAFTGATRDHAGHFVAADGGTLFLDEIGEMPLHLQVKLLTVLQRHEVTPLGATVPTRVDVRVIAATNRDLEVDVREKRFREDLFYRLNVITLSIPALRERLEDLPWLLGRFLRHFTDLHEREELEGIEKRAVEALHAHAWPGNVRELVNVIERAVLLCDGTRIRLRDLPEAIREGRAPIEESARFADMQEEFARPLPEASRRMVERFERAYLEHHLRECHGAVGEVARRAHINPRTLYEKMRRFDLRKEDFR